MLLFMLPSGASACRLRAQCTVIWIMHRATYLEMAARIVHRVAGQIREIQISRELRP